MIQATTEWKVTSKPDPVNNRVGHVVAVWDDITLIWGGLLIDNGELSAGSADLIHECDPREIYCHGDGIWTKRTTHGELPPKLFDGIGEVVGDCLYVACGELSSKQHTRSVFESNDIYRLDLNTWMWTKLDPTGTRPLRSREMASWVSGKNIFLFGGFSSSEVELENGHPKTLKIEDEGNNQLVFYNCEENTWNWPITTGEVPCPRSRHAAFSVSGYYEGTASDEGKYRQVAFVFGGLHCDRDPLYDLHLLDLETMKWECIDEDKYTRWPLFRWGHSLNAVSSKYAVLVGGKSFSSVYQKDIWLLDINKAISQHAGEEIWIHCEHHSKLDEGMFDHRAVKEPSSQRLWILGGSREKDENDDEIPRDNIRELAFSSNQKLKMLALEAVTKSFEMLALKVKELPTGLRQAAEDKYKRKYVIT